MQLKLRVIAALLLLGGLASPLGLGAQDLAASKERLRSFITGEVGKPPALLPSMAIAVVKDDAIVWEDAFGWATSSVGSPPRRPRPSTSRR